MHLNFPSRVPTPRDQMARSPSQPPLPSSIPNRPRDTPYTPLLFDNGTTHTPPLGPEYTPVPRYGTSAADRPTQVPPLVPRTLDGRYLVPRMLHLRGPDHIAAADPVMATLIPQIGPCALPQRRSPYAALVRSIVGQQLSAAAASAIYCRIETVTGGEPSVTRIQHTADEVLIAAGLSRRKLRFIRELTNRVESQQLDFGALSNLPDDQVNQELCTLPGVGPWTADMFLMFVLNRPDVLPLRDAGLQRSFRLLYDLPYSPSEILMQQIAAPWRPYRTVGCWYLWRALDKQ